MKQPMKALGKLLGGRSDAGKPSPTSPLYCRPVVTSAPVVAGAVVSPRASPTAAAAYDPSATPITCNNRCGWTAFPGHPTCCRRCKGPDGPHAEDCPTKNKRWPPLCSNGCKRPAFGSFTTCCTKCTGREGAHTRDCAAKNGVRSSSGATVGSTAAGTPAGAAEADMVIGAVVGVTAAASAPPRTPEEVNEELRMKLVEWHAAGAMKTRAQVDEVIDNLAKSSGMEREAVRMLWLAVARQARPVGAPVEVYVALAKKHHGVEVEVIDLGAASVKHTNSCMFLTCAAALADRRAKGYEDAIPPGFLGDALIDASPDGNAMAPIDELIEQHRRHRAGTLGRMADALRHAACEVLLADAEFFRPYFHPIRSAASEELSEEKSKKAYFAWVEQLRGDEEGDELVILALARLLGIAVQPVQQSGYRVPLMDPTGATEAHCISYWGNDDRHWVWLRTTSEEVPRMPTASRTSIGLAAPPATAAAAAAASGRATRETYEVDLF